MAGRDYDQVILSHYREVAEESGLDPASTMADQRTRQLETDLICDFVALSIDRHRRAGTRDEDIQLMDVGCGNGYTLSVLSERFPKLNFVGFEYTPELRKIANSRFPNGSVRVSEADIRDPDFTRGVKAHIVICQRVLINLLDGSDQAAALTHIVESTEVGSCLLFIECFQSGLHCLNEARAEFDLPPLPTAHHNLYLSDQFFSHRADLRSLESESARIPANFLSTHYFVSRVFHPVLLGNREMKRNSHWVNFFSRALVQAVGNYSPVRAAAFERSAVR